MGKRKAPQVLPCRTIVIKFYVLLVGIKGTYFPLNQLIKVHKKRCTKFIKSLFIHWHATQHFSDLLKKYGLRHIRFHDLRHTFASILINQDVPLLNVSTFLGHSDLATTANIYAHLDKSKKQESADIISNIFNKAKE